MNGSPNIHLLPWLEIHMKAMQGQEDKGSMYRNFGCVRPGIETFIRS